jgi:hypothetical protein
MLEVFRSATDVDPAKVWRAVKVCATSLPVMVKSKSGTVTARLAAGEAVNVEVKLVEPPLNAIAIIFP